ncbi:MAG TPA: hypothetical protein VFQ47_01335 [Nitrososphaera sp.]|jgi:hypothetical protein|nr:hypothetical protein [Nitrososphaera sp.]
MNLKVSILLISALLVSACVSIESDRQAVKIAGKGVDNFHRQLNAEEYQQIYAQSHQEFRSAVGEAKAIDYFSFIRRKLGKVKRAELKNWQENNQNNRTLIALFYETEFDEDKAREEFIWLINGNEAILFRYNIDSPTLVTK